MPYFDVSVTVESRYDFEVEAETEEQAEEIAHSTYYNHYINDEMVVSIDLEEQE